MINNSRRSLSFRPVGWKYDLPGPNAQPATVPIAEFLPNPPNFLDEVVMELPRSTLSARGGAAYMAMMSAIFLGCLVVFYVYGLIYQKGPITAESIICLVLIIMLGWVPIYMWRMDMEAPVDEPIRFNRARRRIYVYRFRYNGYKPLSREAWGVSAEEYDWDHLRAEFCSVYGPMGTGGLVQFVNLAVVDPSTGKVLDRFIFSQGRQQSEMYWAMAQLYMQQGPEAVPKFDKPPRDWNNETHFENIARRFAPRVKWPEEMDLESRSAPDASSQSSSEETTPDSHAGHNQGKAALQKVKSIDDRG